MRLIEILILATLLPTIFGFFFEATIRPEWLMLFPVVTAVLIILHLSLERYRWQMIPAYILFAIVLLISAGSIILQLPAPPTVWRISGASFGFFFFIIAAGLPSLFPIFRVPVPTGPYPVGTTHLNIADNRQTAVQVWYPAGNVSSKPAPYLANAPFFWDWLRLVPTQAYLDAHLADKHSSYPVLIFCHGGGFIAVQNTVQMQELASHGYIIFSISHRYDSAVTVYPDGQSDGRSFWQTWQDMKPVLMDNNEAAATTKALRHDQDGSNLRLADKKAVMQKIFEENRIALEVINRRVDDTHNAINFLEKLNNQAGNHLLSGKLDMNRLGIFGHSNGGAVAVNVAMKDARIKAVINMDGYIFGDVFNSGLKQPFMTMNKEGAQGRDDVIYEQAESKAYYVTIQGANHFNFMDIYLWMPLVNNKFLGSINPQRAVEIMNSYTLAFFDKHLKGKEVFLLQSASSVLPEVLFESRGG